jgi:hypothetical protein
LLREEFRSLTAERSARAARIAVLEAEYQNTRLAAAKNTDDACASSSSPKPCCC